MKNTDQLKKALDLVREADRGAEAPQFLETRLRAAFREQHAAPPATVAPWWSAWRLWTGIAAAGVVLGAITLRFSTPGSVEAPRQTPPPVVAKAPTPPPAAVAPTPQPEPKSEVVAAAPRPKTVRTAPRRPQQHQPLEVQTAAATETQEFLAIPYAPPLTAQDRGEVIRVRVPRQSLRSMGIPVNPERLFERVPADLLVGEDGIPRGIRLVSASERR